MSKLEKVCLTIFVVLFVALLSVVAVSADGKVSESNDCTVESISHVIQYQDPYYINVHFHNQDGYFVAESHFNRDDHTQPFNFDNNGPIELQPDCENEPGLYEVVYEISVEILAQINGEMPVIYDSSATLVYAFTSSIMA